MSKATTPPEANPEASAEANQAQVQAQIQAVEQAQSPEALMVAVQNLATSQSAAAIPALIAVFGYNNPAAAAIALRAVIGWQEAAVAPLIAQLDEYNYGARAYSMRALATIASGQSLEVLINAATNDFAPSVRRAAAKGLGNLRWETLPSNDPNTNPKSNFSADPSPDQGEAQRRVFAALSSLCTDGDWSIRYAGVAGLQALATRVKELEQTVVDFLNQHQESDRSVRARIQWAVNSEQ
ncbi:MAG: HEAT repeat domain-containing protein [Coleofasciculaceae cyanobacterium SM2_1_6]|nr:HEAT repeat domain-containing protein [Coleofasciculaceae cyanobacterium SM2_1_6]